jgi:hypothetical protein
MLPLRLVIDTNVLISAALKPEGLQRTAVVLAVTKPARFYVSPPSWRNTRLYSRVQSWISAKGFAGNCCSWLRTTVTLSARRAVLKSPVIRMTICFSNAPMPRVRIT